MRCQTCQGKGFTWEPHFYPDGQLSRALEAVPCPDCHAGHQHCCDGDRADPEIDATECDRKDEAMQKLADLGQDWEAS